MRAQNPFATRHTQPGAAGFVRWHDRDVQAIANTLQDNGGSGQIVGPHGTGKTTLLRELVPLLERSGYAVTTFELRDQQRALPAEPSLPTEPHSVVVIDGYEQLGWWSRWKVRVHRRRHGVGLIITTHQPQSSLPILATTSADLKLLQQIVDQLMAQPTSDRSIPDDSATSETSVRPSPELLNELLERHHGNMREVLMDLYDWYETRVA